MINPAISIIIPVYNVEKYIRACLDSVIHQSFGNFEVILIDDGSKDKSGIILDEYAQKDNRIHVFHIPNGGVSNARNVGLQQVHGEYVYIMDSDDMLAENALRKLYQKAISSDADVVIGDYVALLESQNGKKVERHFFEKKFEVTDNASIKELENGVLYLTYCSLTKHEIHYIGYGAPWTKLIRASLISKNELSFDPYVKGVFDDNLFALQVFNNAKSVANITDYVYIYRIRANSLVHRVNHEKLMIHDRIFEKVISYGNEKNKDDRFWYAFYARIIQMIVTSYKTYFVGLKHEQNNAYNEFVCMLKTDIYQNAIRKAELTKLTRNHKIVLILARLKMYRLLWFILSLQN